MTRSPDPHDHGLLTRGHHGAVAVVRRAISEERPPHALLLVGPDGIGKTTLALDLAAGLLCTHPLPDARPCRACPSCRKVEHGNHPDLHRIAPDGAGEQIRLAAVQGLASELALLPLEGRFRVAIVEDAHRLNPDAQNALLKTLEEPGAATCIVLVADEEGTLLPTVQSRAARLRMGPVARDATAAWVAERTGVDAVAAAAAAAASGGRPGTALRLASDPEASLVRARLARELLDLTVADRRGRLASVPALMADGATLDASLRATPAIDGEEPPGPSRGRRRGQDGPTGRPARSSPARPQPAERRRAVLTVIDAWRQVGRDLAVVAGGGIGSVNQMDLLEDLQMVASSIDRARLLAFMERLDGHAAAIEAYANPELVLDSLVIGWPRAERIA